jgi:hypothetical protein
MANWVADFLARNPDIAALPVYKRAKHSIHFRNPDGSIQAHFVGAPCHYENGPGNWETIDTALVDHGTYHQPTGVPIKYESDAVKVVGGTYSQKPARLVRLRPSNGQIQQFANIPSGGTISGDSVSKSGTGWTHVVRFLESGIKEELTLSQQPSFPGGTQSTDYIMVEEEVAGVTFPDGWIDSEFTVDGYTFYLPKAHDANGDIPCRRWALTSGGVQYIYTGVLVSYLQSASYPVVVDPDFLDSTADGYIYGFDAVYANAHTTTYDLDVTDSKIQVGQSYYTSYKVQRVFLKFDTSSIGAQSIISVNMTLAVLGLSNSEANFDVQIVKQDWSGTDPITYGNMETPYDGCYNGSADDNIWRNTSGIVLNTAYTSGSLSTSWVDTDGSTYYSLRSSLDKSDSVPAGSQFISLYSQEETTESYRPVLTVTYSSTISGSVCWGHSTGVAEANTRTFAGNWTGTGSISGSGDAEVIDLQNTEYLESELVNTGSTTVQLLQNVYDSGDSGALYYKTGSDVAACQADSWHAYSAPFVSLGYVQVRVQYS